MNHTRRTLAFLIILALALAGCAGSPESQRKRFTARGKDLMGKSDYSRAILEFRNAMQAEPKHPDPYYQIALASLAMGDLATGVASLRKTLEIDPKHPEARLKMAQLMANASENSWVKEAETSLRELIANSPDNPEVLNSLAFAELRLGKTDEAIRTLEKALSAAPKEMSIAAALARAKVMSGDAAGAEAVLKAAVRNAPNSAEAHITMGLFYLSRNRPPEAEAEFRKGVEVDPKSARALFNLARLHNSLGRKKEAEAEFKQTASLGSKDFAHIYGVFLFEEGRRDEAINEFERLFRQDPGDRTARTRLIVAMRTVGRQADAAKILAKALESNPNDLEGLLQRAAMLVETGEYGQAETDLNKVLRLKPDSGEVHYLLARVHRGRGTMRSYKMELSEALQHNPMLLPARLELVQRLLAENEHRAAADLLNGAPDSQKQATPVLVQRNWVYWASGDLAAMRKGIDEAFGRGRTAEVLVQDGLWKLRSGNTPGARAALEEALKIDPSDVRALQGLNMAFTSEKQGGAALAKVKEYAAKQPKSAPVQEFLGLMLLGSGDRAGASQAFSLAKAADPKYVRADMALTQVDVLEGKFDQARRRLETLVSADNSNTLARLWLGNVQATTGDFKAATEQFRQVVAAESNNAQALNNLAYLLAETGNQPSEALKYAQKAKELSPGTAEYSDTLGWVFYRQGLYPLAVRELERVATQNDNPVWKYHLAMAYARAGDMNRGRAVLKVALAHNPNLPEAKTATELLQVSR